VKKKKRKIMNFIKNIFSGSDKSAKAEVKEETK
jgi:hypothetical protein